MRQRSLRVPYGPPSTSIALPEISSKLPVYDKGLTTPAIPNYIVYCPYEVGEDCVCVVEASENGDDIRTRVGVSFAQDRA
jgi:hypothetical protein